MIDRLGRGAFAGLFIVSGLLHFVMPKPFIHIVPPVFRRPDLLVMISGGAEILGGIGLLMPRFRRPAGYGLALLLAGVFPANIYMAVAHVPFEGLLGNRWLQWLRLPVQFPLIWLALHYANPKAAVSPSEPPMSGIIRIGHGAGDRKCYDAACSILANQKRLATGSFTLLAQSWP